MGLQDRAKWPGQKSRGTDKYATCCTLVLSYLWSESEQLSASYNIKQLLIPLSEAKALRSLLLLSIDLLCCYCSSGSRLSFLIFKPWWVSRRRPSLPPQFLWGCKLTFLWGRNERLPSFLLHSILLHFCGLFSVRVDSSEVRWMHNYILDKIW